MQRGADFVTSGHPALLPLALAVETEEG